jgi:large subunit ribosomal protein L21
MYAVIQTGGKQYRVQEGDVVRVECLPVEAGETVEFDRVLAVGGDEDTRIGTPTVDGARVSGTVLRHGRAAKIRVYTFKRRQNSNRRTKGHRQGFSEVRIDGIRA